MNLLNAAKRPDVVLKLELIKKPLGLLALVISIPYGVIAMCFANLAICVFAVVLNTILTSRTLAVPFWKQVMDLMPILVNSVVMGVCVYASTYFIRIPSVSLFLGILIGAVYYIVSSYIFMPELMKEAYYLVKRKS